MSEKKFKYVPTTILAPQEPRFFPHAFLIFPPGTHAPRRQKTLFTNRFNIVVQEENRGKCLILL